MFLTLEDPRAKIQGSRDPLGVQPVWVSFGRQVVTNLTSVTTVVRGFTTLMLGRHFGQMLVESGQAGEEDLLSIFLRVEQLAAYASHVVHNIEDDVRGTRRVRRFINEANGHVLISDHPSRWILSDQKTYGLWGLYTTAARASGLVADGPLGLTARARDFVDRSYGPALQQVHAKLMRLAREGGKLSVSKSDPVLKALAEALGQLSTREREFYGTSLRDGSLGSDPRSSRQKLLAELLVSHTDLEEPIIRTEVKKLARAAGRHDPSLADCLERIAALEALFAPAEALFDYIRVSQRQKLSSIASHIRGFWGSRVPDLNLHEWDRIRPGVERQAGPETTVAMGLCYAALASGDYGQAILALLDWNRIVMDGRKASPWVRLIDGKLDVRYRALEHPVPEADELISLWRNSYFLNALKSITRQTTKGDAI